MPRWPPIPAHSLNQKKPALGIPIDSAKSHPALAHDAEHLERDPAVNIIGVKDHE